MSEFTGPFEDSDSALLEQQVTDQLATVFQGWAPAAGDPEFWLTKAFARIGSQVFDQATVLLRSAFQRFGESVVGVPPIQAAPAYTIAKFTLADTLGHEAIPAGTEISVPVDADRSVGFRTIEAVEVPAGVSSVHTGVEAIEPGEEGNSLSGAANPVDPIAYVTAIELEAPSTGGVDEEDEDAYLDRLVEELQTLSLSLIVGADFERDARSVAGVARAKAIEAYNSDTSTEEVLSVSVYPITAAGTALSTKAKEELQARQQAKVPSGVIVHVHDAAYQKVDVTVEAIAKPGSDPATVKAAIEERLAAYLSPATYGLPEEGDPSSGGGWVNNPTIYLYELVSEIDRVGGVERVKLVKQAKHGSSVEAKDVTLSSGKVALPEAGTFSVSVS